MESIDTTNGTLQGEVLKSELSPLIERVIAIARGELGVVEVPVGANRGPRIDDYLKSVGLTPGQPWCAAFVYWCFEQASARLNRVNPLVRTGSCMKHWHCTRGQRILAEEIGQEAGVLQPGDIFILDRGAGLGHTGLIVGISDGVAETLEGNSHPGEGSGGVFYTRRAVGSLRPGVIRYV